MDKYVTPLQSGDLQIDCYRIEIKSMDGTVFCEGAGYIRQRAETGFEVKVFVIGLESLGRVFGGVDAVPGSLITEDEYFTLEADDTDGHRWTAERITRPHGRLASNAIGHVVVASCREIIMRQNGLPAYSSVKMTAFQTVHFPRTHPTTVTTSVGARKKNTSSALDCAVFEACDLEFELSCRDGVTTLEINGKREILHPHLESRATEALLFILTRKVEWSIIVRSERGAEVTILRSPRRQSSSKQWPVPILFRLTDESEQIWQLFSKYFEYLMVDVIRPFHSLSAQVLSLAKSLEGSVEVQALAAAIAIESVLDVFYGSFGKPDQKTVVAVRELLEYVKCWTGEPRIKDRAVGSLNQMSGVRPGDRLRDLLELGRVSKVNVDAWRKLRNSVAHGDWSGLENLQQFVDRTSMVHVLFYQLIFNLIGFRGKHTNWGVPGWPTIDYPPSPEGELVGEH